MTRGGAARVIWLAVEQTAVRPRAGEGRLDGHADAIGSAAIASRAVRVLLASLRALTLVRQRHTCALAYARVAVGLAVAAALGIVVPRSGLTARQVRAAARGGAEPRRVGAVLTGGAVLVAKAVPAVSKAARRALSAFGVAARIATRSPAGGSAAPGGALPVARARVGPGPIDAVRGSPTLRRQRAEAWRDTERVRSCRRFLSAVDEDEHGAPPQRRQLQTGTRTGSGCWQGTRQLRRRIGTGRRGVDHGVEVIALQGHTYRHGRSRHGPDMLRTLPAAAPLVQRAPGLKLSGLRLDLQRDRSPAGVPSGHGGA